MVRLFVSLDVEEGKSVPQLDLSISAQRNARRLTVSNLKWMYKVNKMTSDGFHTKREPDEKPPSALQSRPFLPSRPGKP